jgi:TolB-like protein/Tfp pilus assembly protein PilF
MPDTVTPQKVLRFGEFEVDLRAGLLFKRGVKVRLREQVFEVLSMLLEHAGEVVTREELKKRLWPGDVIVDFELNLNTAVARLREALGDSAERPRFIETLPKRGYRFIGSVEVPARAARQAPSTRARIVVLPFANLGGDPDQEYLSDVITEELITGLAGLAPGELGVIARTTAMHYKGSHKDVARIGHELGVDYIVEGGVRCNGDQVTINVQLIETSDQTHVFAKKYDAEKSDIFKELDRAAADIVERIGITAASHDESGPLSTGGQPRRKPTEDVAAYNEYIKARHYMVRSTAEGFVLATQHLKNAIARDPEFDLAYEGLADVNWYLGYFGLIPPRTAFSTGIALALRALEIDNSRAETHALLGAFHKTIEYNWPEVHREMALGLQLNPNSPLVRLRYAVSFLMPQGRLEEATNEIQIALESDPLSMEMHTWLGVVLAVARKWDLTIDQGRQILQLDPSSFWGHFIMGTAYRGKRMFEEAVTAHRKAVEISGGVAALIGWLGLTLGLSGNAAEARSLLGALHARAEQGFVPPTSLAWIYLGLAEIDAAFEWLNRAVDECDQFMMPIKSYEFLDPIRADPRFLTLLHKMNLEP